MEKIININFHSRVIAIEESAYEALKQYTGSLRRHFADEESSEEIVTDIENRIAELLAGRLKQGAPCINIADLNAVIDSIGRIEDIKAAEGDPQQQDQQRSAGSSTSQQQPFTTAHSDRFYRNADDKIIAGVCRGLADRMNIDPVVVRIIFVIFFGAFFWIYLLLWLILPSQSNNTHITRRLFRNPDDKQVAGVCGGLAKYFHTDSWKVRTLFLLPLIFSGVLSSLHPFAWHWGFGPGVFAGSLGSSFFLLYIILWIAVPYATTDTEKMEMRGERIDINSIKAATQARGGAPVQQPRGSGLGRVLGIIFKAFFILIAGSIALGLFGGLIGMVFAGSVAMPFTRFFLDGWEQHVLLWTGVVLSMGIPLLALIVWIIRRIAGVRTQRHYLGYVFAVLWFIGVTCSLITAANVVHNFTDKAVTEQEVTVQQPTGGTLYLGVAGDGSSLHSKHYSRWFGDWDEEDDVPFRLVNDDSMWLNTVRVTLEQSNDSLFHVYKACSSRGGTSSEARTFAGHIVFEIQQHDSVINMPRGFVISRKDRFRNQQVLITVEVPVGKAVQVSGDVDDYSWFTIDNDGHGGYEMESWDNDSHRYGNDNIYTMTPNGLRKKFDTTSTNNRPVEDTSKSSDY